MEASSSLGHFVVIVSANVKDIACLQQICPLVMMRL